MTKPDKPQIDRFKDAARETSAEMTKEQENQSERFIEKARELGCDKDEGRFNETLKRIAPKKDEKKPTEE